MTEHRSFPGYAYHRLTHATRYTHWKNLLTYFRRFRTVAFLLRMASVLLTALETGAAVLLSTVLFLLILPLATALTAGILLTARLQSHRTNRYLSRKIADSRVYVLFLTDAGNPFLQENARSLAAKGHTVILLSPYWISAKGLQNRGRFYCTVRQEEDGIYLMRRYYFFSFRKHVLKQERTVYLY